MFSQFKPISDKTPVQSLLRISITIFTGFLVVGPFIGAAIAALVYEVSIPSLFIGPFDATIVNPLLLLQAISGFIGLIVFPILHVTGLEHKPLSPFFSNKTQLMTVLGIVVLIALTFPIAASPITSWNATLDFPDFMSKFENWARDKEDLMTKVTGLFTSFDTAGGLLVTLFVVAVLPAIGEELTFRGLIQNELWRGSNNIHVAIWASAFVFSAIHVQFFGFVPRVLLGALFGYLYYWSGNLLVPIVAHFVNNAFSVIMIYLYNIKAISTDFNSTEPAPWHWVIVCGFITVFLLKVVRDIYLRPAVGAADRSY